MKDFDTWSVESSRNLYGVDNWGDEYFSINSRGEASVFPSGKSGPEISLKELCLKLQQEGLEPPFLLRFNDILEHRLKRISSAFQLAMNDRNYSGSYIPAYPIKVNQQKQVVEALQKAGQSLSIGLEAGSKPEMVAVMAMHRAKDSLILCNGYKDRDYLNLALMAKKVGRRPIVVIEKFSELENIISLIEDSKVEIELGLRLRVSGKGSGRWENSGGDRAKFGLTVSETLKALSFLKGHNREHLLSLLHFHVGSQITRISSLREALKEAAQVYIQLNKCCPSLKILDIGGGLGVDYDGSKSAFASSMNYSVEEYARDVVRVLDETCEKSSAPVPDIITEAGRATSAHHSILLFNVLGVANRFDPEINTEEVAKLAGAPEVRSLVSLFDKLSLKNCQETLHDAIRLRNDVLAKFSLGQLSIEDRAHADDCFWALLSKLANIASELSYIPEDLQLLPNKLSDTYFCNLSIFQSLPDHWAIDQVFPVMPIDRHTERPTRKVILGDITCDSDGQINKFPDLRDVSPFLPAHSLKPEENYFFAAYLLGAYQEILGDLHNLFGDTNAVHLQLSSSGEIEISEYIKGDSVSDVLNYVGYKREAIEEAWSTSLKQSLSEGQLQQQEAKSLHKKYIELLSSYTYLSQ